MDGDDERLTFLGRGVPAAFVLRSVTIAPGASLAVDAGRWRDALVVVEAGDLEVECEHGDRHRFAAGAVLCLVGPDPVALRNVGAEPVVLVGVTRREA